MFCSTMASRIKVSFFKPIMLPVQSRRTLTQALIQSWQSLSAAWLGASWEPASSPSAPGCSCEYVQSGLLLLWHSEDFPATQTADGQKQKAHLSINQGKFTQLAKHRVRKACGLTHVILLGACWLSETKDQQLGRAGTGQWSIVGFLGVSFPPRLAGLGSISPAPLSHGVTGQILSRDTCNWPGCLSGALYDVPLRASATVMAQTPKYQSLNQKDILLLHRRHPKASRMGLVWQFHAVRSPGSS